jgi:hypothetical protein
MNRLLRLSLVPFALACLVAGALPASARGKGPQTAPGKYKEWNGEIDLVEVVKTFKLADYERVVVQPFETKDVALPDRKDNTYQPVKNVLANVTGPFVDGLNGEIPGRLHVGQEGGGASKTLKIRGKVVLMDPGSQAARYWVGFGAGATKTGIEGEIVDEATGEVLVRFEQERRSGVGRSGGNYEELFDRNLAQIGEDIAGLLKAF